MLRSEYVCVCVCIKKSNKDFYLALWVWTSIWLFSSGYKVYKLKRIYA